MAVPASKRLKRRHQPHARPRLIRNLSQWDNSGYDSIELSEIVAFEVNERHHWHSVMQSAVITKHPHDANRRYPGIICPPLIFVLELYEDTVSAPPYSMSSTRALYADRFICPAG
jgi:hypothetical protein